MKGWSIFQKIRWITKKYQLRIIKKKMCTMSKMESGHYFSWIFQKILHFSDEISIFLRLKIKTSKFYTSKIFVLLKKIMLILSAPSEIFQFNFRRSFSLNELMFFIVRIVRECFSKIFVHSIIIFIRRNKVIERISEYGYFLK